MKLDNDARLRHDYSEYRAMLKELRRSEESFQDGSKIVYLLQVIVAVKVNKFILRKPRQFCEQS